MTDATTPRYLPNEILTLILRSCSPREQAIISRTAKRLHAIVQSRLYERVEIGSPAQAENFSRTILKRSDRFAPLVKEFRVIIIYCYNSQYDSKSLTTLLNTVLLRLEKLRVLRLVLELADKSYLHLALSYCTFRDLHTFHFGHTGRLGALGVLQFIQRHPHLENLSIDTDDDVHPNPEHPEFSGDSIVLSELRSYSGPLNFLKYIAKSATSLSSIIIKLRVKPGVGVPVDQLAALEEIHDMGKGVSLAFDTSASLSPLVEWTSAALPKLQNFAAYCRKVDALPVRSRPGLSQEALDRFAVFFSGSRHSANLPTVNLTSPIPPLPINRLTASTVLKTRRPWVTCVPPCQRLAYVRILLHRLLSTNLQAQTVHILYAKTLEVGLYRSKAAAQGVDWCGFTSTVPPQFSWNQSKELTNITSRPKSC
ncbi:hypothetical protein E1B28_004570 [Marasmius oreades]|uniref:F-box domain-containing protein n=1 Tax=Marasmius oreades TaxID=181124 RepID=A0A9P8AD44_9AGAR|nr:uncharacterized protein E1B28_004570 [Marasmius oreades]KAG7097199.1 hypothetical protein E1B28_004570 [Marasmius oreades]